MRPAPKPRHCRIIPRTNPPPRPKTVQTIQFTALLKTPIIMRGHLTFDALLAALLFDRDGGRWQDAHQRIPLRQTDGLYHASAAILEGGVRAGKVGFSASLRARHDLDPGLIKKGKDGVRLHRKLDEKRRRAFGNVFNTYSAITARAVSWYCEGDVEAIKDLLHDARFIGKRRASGFGEIVEGQRRIETGVALDGLVDENGKPMRPIPVEMFTGDRSLPIVDAAWRPPYWHPANRAPCYAPPLVGQGTGPGNGQAAA